MAGRTQKETNGIVGYEKDDLATPSKIFQYLQNSGHSIH